MSKEDGDLFVMGRLEMTLKTIEEIRKNAFFSGWKALEEADIRDPTCSDETIEEEYQTWVEKNFKGDPRWLDIS